MKDGRKLNKLLEDKLGRIRSALLKGNLQSFKQEFLLDVVSEYYLDRWFQGYAVKIAVPNTCEVTMKRLEIIKKDYFWGYFDLTLGYTSYMNEAFNFKIKLKEKEEHLYIVEVQIVTMQPNSKNTKRLDNQTILNMKRCLYERKDELYSKQRWKKAIILTEKKHKEVRASLYARSVSRSVRFRNTHPEIDCGAVWANIMSYKMVRLAFIIKNYSLENKIFILHQYTSKFFKVNTYDEYKEEGESYYPARELSLLPLYSVDEILEKSKHENVTEMNCVDFGSFYMSLLILNGIAIDKICIVIQPFHYLTVVELSGKCYVISNNEIYPMEKDRLYGDTDIMRIVSPYFYIDSSIGHEIEEKDYRNIKNIFNKYLKVFCFPDTKGKFKNPIDKFKFDIEKYSTPEEYHSSIITYVEDMSRSFPNSIFNWSLYSYQSLCVNQPQAYVIWSLKSPLIKMMKDSFKGINDVILWVKNEIEDQSIFDEEDRIMTADQAIRSRSTDGKGKAMLIYTLLKAMNFIDEGCIVLTKKHSYVIYVKGKESFILDTDILGYIVRIEEKIVLAFNEHSIVDIEVYLNQ